jgi:hypothetical protein
MIQINISLSSLSAERLWEHGKPAPPEVHISTNVNVTGFEQRDEKLAIPFVTTISYAPSIAQISLRGQAILSGEREEIERIKEEYKRQRSPPAIVIQTITNVSLIEATVLSRSLNIPPPIPLPLMVPESKPDKERPSYVG